MLETKTDEPIINYLRKDFITLSIGMSVPEALDKIRKDAAANMIHYFYVVDESEKLCGTVSAKKLLTEDLDKTIKDIMDSRSVAIPHECTVFDACEYFAIYKFLAFPVVDDNMKILGVVDVNLYTNELFDINERKQTDSFFNSMGFRISQIKNASVFQGYKFRFPWLLATISSGVICAVLTSFFQTTLTENIILAFFLTLVLGLGESVSIQTMSITIHAIHYDNPTPAWFWKSLKREVGTSLLLGVSCAIIVGSIAAIWKSAPLTGFVIGCGIASALLLAATGGIIIPYLLHRMKMDLKIACGPITLACADIMTIFSYLSLAKLFIR